MVIVTATESEIIERVRRHWLAAAGGRDMPDWSDIDPAMFGRALPNMAVVAIELPFRAYFRLAGTVIEVIRGKLTGRHLDEIAHLPCATKSVLSQAIESSVRARRDVVFDDILERKDGKTHPTSGSVFPLSPPGGRVQRCLVVEDYGGISPEGLSRDGLTWGFEAAR